MNTKQLFVPMALAMKTKTLGVVALPLFVTGLAMLGLLGWRRKRKAIA